MNVVHQITGYLRRLTTQPVDELNRAQHALRFAVDLARHCARQLSHNHATQMAAALTYRTIFGLVPVTVLMLLVFRAFGGFEQVSIDLQSKVHAYLGLTSIALPTHGGQSSGDVLTVDLPQDPEGRTADAIPDDADHQLRASIDKIIADITAKASEMNVGSIGVVGLALLIWAGLALLITVERSFNQIYNCPSGRSWHLRVSVYWAVITLGPVLLFVSLYMGQQLIEAVQHLGAGRAPVLLGRAANGLGGATAFAASWLLLFLLYALLPNTRVRLRPALIGAFVAAALWETGKWGFSLYVTKAVSYSTLYGSLGLVPLFLLWMYLTWLIVLFGLEITYTLQAMRGREFEKEAARLKQHQVYDSRWLVPIVARIGRAFCQGRAIGVDDLARALGLPQQAVVELGQRLHEAGLVHSVAAGGEDGAGYSLARRPEDITIKGVLELGRAMSIKGPGQSNDPAWEILGQLTQAQLDAVGGLTLAGLLDHSGTVAGGPNASPSE